MQRRQEALLIGAGFSHDFGMPLVWELTKEITDYLTPDKFRSLNNGWHARGQGFPVEVVDAFTGVLVDDRLHYEQMVGWLQDRYLSHDKYAEKYHSLHLWLIQLVGHLLAIRHEQNGDFILKSVAFYRGLAVLAARRAPVWIFSLNHDLCIEIAAAELGITLSAGFPDRFVVFPARDEGGEPIGHVRFRQLRREELRAGTMPFLAPGEPGINLVKLHGSLDTFVHTDERHWIRLEPEQVTGAAWIRALAKLEGGLYCEFEGHRGKTLFEIACPDDEGEIQFLRRTILSGAHKFSERVAQNAPVELLRVFANVLKSVNKMTVMGYGYGDTHINKLIDEWLESSAENRLLYVTPRGHLPDSLTSRTNQVELSAMTAVDFLAACGCTQRTEEEELLWRLRARARASESRETHLVELEEFVTEELVRIATGFLNSLPEGIEHSPEQARQLYKEYLSTAGFNLGSLLRAYVGLGRM